MTLADYDLKGAVLSLKDADYYVVFDKKGNVTYLRSFERLNKESHPYLDTVVLYEDFFKYDSRGNLTYHRGGRRFNQTDSRKYDEKGRLVEEIYLKPDGSLKWRLLSTYDYNGTRYTHSHVEGKAVLTGISRFDAKGNLLEKTGYDAKGKMVYSETLQYNSDGLLTEKVLVRRFSYDSTAEWRELYGYDNRGNNIIYREWSGKTLLKNTTSKFDDRHNVTELAEQAYDEFGMLRFSNVTTYRYTYNKKGWLIEKTRGESGDDISKEVFSNFDKYGNYTVHEHFVENWDSGKLKNKFQMKSTREMEYYR